MKSLNKQNDMATHVESYLGQIELNDLETDLDSYATMSILGVKYEKVDIEEVAEEECNHLGAK